MKTPTPQKKECCEKCLQEIDSADGMDTYCGNRSCPCHTEAPQEKSPVEMMEKTQKGLDKKKAEIEESIRVGGSSLYMFPQESGVREDAMDILNLLQDSVEKWSKQGRTDDQIWAVKNYLTGLGRNAVKQEIAKARGEHPCNCNPCIDYRVEQQQRHFRAGESLARTSLLQELLEEVGKLRSYEAFKGNDIPDPLISKSDIQTLIRSKMK